MVWSLALFVVCAALGIAFIWDVGGFAARLRRQLDWDPVYRALYRRLPWFNRAFGVWCIVFGVGQLIYFYGFTHGMWS